MKRPLIHLALFFLAASPALAVMTSPNYRISEDFTGGGGGGALASPAFKIEEGGIDFISRKQMSTPNFRLDGLGSPSYGAKVPEILSVAPATPSRFYTDETPSYAVTAFNPASGGLQYRLMEGAVVKRAWSTNSTLSYGITPADKGGHSLSLQVKNSNGTVAYENRQYVFRRPAK